MKPLLLIGIIFGTVVLQILFVRVLMAIAACQEAQDELSDDRDKGPVCDCHKHETD